MQYSQLIKIIADILKEYDAEKPIHKLFKAGIGPFGEPQIVSIISARLNQAGVPAKTRRTPDLDIQGEWAIEFKIVRPFGDNGKEAQLQDYNHKGLFIIGYEHNPPKISLDPIIASFELIAQNVMKIKLGDRIEEKRIDLVHPEHQVVRCIGWELG